MDILYMHHQMGEMASAHRSAEYTQINYEHNLCFTLCCTLRVVVIAVTFVCEPSSLHWDSVNTFHLSPAMGQCDYSD